MPAHAWQAAETTGDWTLVGCTVAPGFEFAKFELAPKGWMPSDRSRSPRKFPGVDRNAGKHSKFAKAIEPAILYFGTPVVLIGSNNEDSSFNLAPMSSAWWVGWRCMLGLARNPDHREHDSLGRIVLNLPSAALVGAVDHWHAPPSYPVPLARRCAATVTRATSSASAV